MKYFSKLIQFLITMLISSVGIYLFFSDGYTIDEFLLALDNIKVVYIAIPILLLMLSVYFRAYRWKLFFNDEDNTEIYFLFKSEFIGYFANNILPFRMGEVLRAIIVSDKYKISKAYVFGTIIIERLFDIFTALFLGLIVLLFLPLDILVENLFKFNFLENKDIVYALIIILFLMILPVIVSAIIYKYINKDSENSIIKFVVKIFSSFNNLDKTKILPIIVSSLIIWTIYWLDVYFISLAFDKELISLTLLDSMLVLVGSTIGLAIPSLPGSWGTFHLGIDILLNKVYLFEQVSRKNFIMVLHLYGFITYTLCGFIYFFTVDFNKVITNLIGFRKNEKD